MLARCTGVVAVTASLPDIVLNWSWCELYVSPSDVVSLAIDGFVFCTHAPTLSDDSTLCVCCLHRVERHKVAPGRKHQKHQDTIAAADNRRRYVCLCATQTCLWPLALTPPGCDSERQPYLESGVTVLLCDSTVMCTTQPHQNAFSKPTYRNYASANG